MKNRIIVVLLCFFSVSASGQSLVADSLQHQIEVNATAFITQLFNLSGNSSFGGGDYIFSYKKRRGKSQFRFGFGGDFSVKEADEGSDSTFGLRLRVGKEGYTDFGKRWRVFYGGDFKTNLSFTSFGNTDISRTVAAIGGGPVCGIRFQINRRLYLSTEASYDVFLSIEDQDGTTRLGAFSGFSAPDFIYLGFGF